MANFDQMADKIKWMSPDLIRFLEKYLRKLPSVKKEIDSQTDSMVSDLETIVKPYSGKFQSHTKLPELSLIHISEPTRPY